MGIMPGWAPSGVAPVRIALKLFDRTPAEHRARRWTKTKFERILIMRKEG